MRTKWTKPSTEPRHHEKAKPHCTSGLDLVLDGLKLQAQQNYQCGFNAGRKQGMKDAAEIVDSGDDDWSARRHKHAILEALEKLP